ncbi:MAG: hypothetical protein RL417_2118 [Pseudomonadota bacterium]|jgi:hypothetical protein
MNDLIVSLDILAAVCSIAFLARCILSGRPLEDIVLFGNSEKRSLMNQHIRRRAA